MNQSSVSLVKPGGKLESATNVEKREDVINEEQLLPNTTIVTHCIYRNDTETLKRCFEDPTSPYKDQMNELLNQRDDDGKSPLDVAAILERTDIVKMLIQFGADVNIFTSKGYSCLHYAALWGRLEVLQILVENGGNLYQRNIHGETPRDAALRYNQTESATYLELAEEKGKLQSEITKALAQIHEMDKSLAGRITRDEKNIVINTCKGKQEWLNNISTEVALDVKMQCLELTETVQPVLVKLSDPCTMGLLSLGGQKIGNEAYAWTAVVVFPINSAANSVLYTLLALMENWDKFKNGDAKFPWSR